MVALASVGKQNDKVGNGRPLGVGLGAGGGTGVRRGAGMGAGNDEEEAAAEQAEAQEAAAPPGRRGTAHLHAGGLHPLRTAQRTRHAGAGAGLHHPRGDPGARPRPGDRQRAAQRPAHLGQVRRRPDPAEPDPGRQRHPHRDTRRRDARHSGPVRPGRQRRRAGDRHHGQYAWRPEFRRYFTDPLFTRFETSVSGRQGPIEYTLGSRTSPRTAAPAASPSSAT